MRWPSGPGSEHEPAIDPRAAKLGAVRGLGGRALLQGLSRQLEQRQVLAAAARVA
jgi:hypothetical protein